MNGIGGGWWLFLLILAAALGCGSGNNGGEAKNNMAVAKGTKDSAALGTPQASAPVGKPVVLFFGTSLTAGLGLSPDQAFPALIEKKAAAEGMPITAVNAGLSGETTAGAARRIDWVLRTPANLVVIEGGANDALRGLSPDAARSNLEQVIAAIREKQPKAKIVLLQMEAPPNYGVPYTRSFHAIYPDIAKKENIPLAPPTPPIPNNSGANGSGANRTSTILKKDFSKGTSAGAPSDVPRDNVTRTPEDQLAPPAYPSQGPR
jgi:acyl-CoA thioesterase-1